MVSLERYIISPNGKSIINKLTNKPVKMFSSNNYLQCCIYDENGKHIMGVHDVVAQYYCHDWFDGCVVHHKDHNPKNNNVENLECLSRSDHTKLHVPVKYIDKIIVCPICKKEFVWSRMAQSRFNRNRSKSGPYCSRKCSRSINEVKNGIGNNKRRVICIETSETFESIKQASEALGISYGQLWHCLNGDLKSAHKMHFKYA